MISQIIAEVLLNISRILNKVNSFSKQVYEKEWTRNIQKKKHQNNYFRAEISQKEEQLSRLKVKQKIHF